MQLDVHRAKVLAPLFSLVMGFTACICPILQVTTKRAPLFSRIYAYNSGVCLDGTFTGNDDRTKALHSENGATTNAHRYSVGITPHDLRPRYHVLVCKIMRKLIDVKYSFAPRMTTDASGLVRDYGLVAGYTLRALRRHIIWYVHTSSPIVVIFNYSFWRCARSIIVFVSTPRGKVP